MPYRPVACQTTYRLVIVRKNLTVNEPKQARLFADYRYFLYFTNDWDSTLPELVFSANDRCQQENVIAQLAAVRAWHAPVDNLLSNEAYMLMTALAWNLKASLHAISLPEKSPLKGSKPSEKKASAVGEATTLGPGVSHVCELLLADSSAGCEGRSAGRGSLLASTPGNQSSSA